MRSFLISLIVSFIFVFHSASAQINSHLKEEFHDAEAFGVRVVDTRKKLRSALADESVRILAFQSFGEELDTETQKDILEWVRSGHSFWFYDANLAPWFGMKKKSLSGDDFNNKPESGELGGKKRKGVATTAMSIGGHAVQTGVGQVTIFLPQVGEEAGRKSYGAIAPGGDTKLLLQSAFDSPGLMACRREGRGFILFKTLLWNEPLSGDRFQLNLLEYSAGYQVPGPAGVGKVGSPPGPEAEYVQGDPAVELGQPLAVVPDAQAARVKGSDTAVDAQVKPAATGAWRLQLRDGKTIVGELQNDIIEFETSSRSLKLDSGEVKSIEFGTAVTLDKIESDAGGVQSGLLLSSPIRFRTERGVEEFEKEDLTKLSRGKNDTVD